MEFDLKLKSNKYLANNWQYFKNALEESFSHSVFNPGFSTKYLLEEIYDEAITKVNPNIYHMVAFHNKEIMGGVFCVQKENKSDVDYCDVGWIFTCHHLNYYKKIFLFDLLVNSVHQVIVKAGFRKIITEIGTKEGERLLSKRHGYIQISDYEKNKWIKDLI